MIADHHTFLQAVAVLSPLFLAACDRSQDVCRALPPYQAPKTPVASAQHAAQTNEVLGEPVDPMGWVVRHANGDPLDLREVNLLKVPASGHRNSYRTFWGVWERWRLVEKGLNPNDVFARRRKAFKAKRNPKILGDTYNPPTSIGSAPIIPPMPASHSTTGRAAND